VSEKQLEVADIDPAHPHALRNSGMTATKLNRINETAVEFMAGHELDETTKAHWMAPHLAVFAFQADAFDG